MFDKLSPIHPDPERNLTYSSFHSLRRTDEPGKMQELIAIHLGTNTDTHILRIPLGAYLPQVAYDGLNIFFFLYDLLYCHVMIFTNKTLKL